MRPPPQGQVVINLKTTITAHGTHSGVIVHSGIQASPYSNGSSEGSLWSLGHHSSRVPQIETPGGTRIAAAASPLPLTIGPSTSQDHLNTSWNRPFASPQPPTRSESFDHFNGFREIERRPEPPLRSPQPSFLPQRSGSYDHLDRRIQQRQRPPTPPSPIYDFTGRNTPPDEFIEPSKITLNVFDPGRRTPTTYDVGLRRSQPSAADALINDTVTTTTTVEVFRAPIDQGKKFVSLPPPPAPGLDDRPQLLRLDGPAYEKWSNTKSETLINDRPVVNKAVQWREKLVEKEISNGEYDGNRLVDSRSPFANAILPPRPPSSTHQYYTPTVHHIDERLVPPMVSRSTSPYMVQSPSEFSMTSHPMITSSNEEERNHRYFADSRGNSAMGYHQPIRTFESPSNMAQLRVQPYSRSSGMNGNTPILTSPVYVEPRRHHEERPRDMEVDRYGYSTVDRRPRDSGRRSKSVHRKKTREEELRARSVSPLSRRPSWADDPNRLPNMPRRSNSRDVFHLYETRDAFDNVVSQFSELEMCELAGGLLLSPLAESEESLISETSARNDRAKADYLENREIPNFDIYKIAEKFYQSRNPLMISKSADHIYAKPRSKEIEEDEDDEEEHIYEDIDSVRESISTSNLAKVYHTVAEDYGEYEEIPPPLPPRRKRSKEESLTREDQQKTVTEEIILSESLDEPKKNVERPTDLGMSSSEEDRILQGTSSDSGSTLSTTTADSSDSGAPSFAEVVFVEDEWPPPPQLFRKPRKAHPDGHVFPRITSSVQLLPRLPEDKEYSSEKEDSGGIPLSPLNLEIFEKEPKPASPIGRTQISPVPLIPEVKAIDEKSPGSTGTVFEEEDLPFVDASPRILSPSL